MPLPKPWSTETRSKFVSRCMGDSIMGKEYPDQKQRVAVCNSQWERAKKDMSSYYPTRGGTFIGAKPRRRRKKRGVAMTTTASDATTITLGSKSHLIVTSSDNEIDKTISEVVDGLDLGSVRSSLKEKYFPSVEDDWDSSWRYNYDFSKVEDEKDHTYVMGPVMVPDKEDKQGDIVSAEVIEKAAHDFMENDGRSGLMHQLMLGKRQATVVESFILRSKGTMLAKRIKTKAEPFEESRKEFTTRVSKAAKKFAPGTWFIGMKVFNPKLRKLILEGHLRGFSIGGQAKAV